MACSRCGSGRRRAGATKPKTGVQVLGYDFVPPGGGAAVRYLTELEAQRAQRRHGGGTITEVTKGG